MIRSAFGFTVVAIMAASALPAQAADEDLRIEAFRTACIPDRQDFAALKERAAAGGWAAATGEEHPELRAVLDNSAKLIEPEPGMGMAMATFQRELGGRRLFLIVTRVTSEIIDLVGCYIYDFDATAAVAHDAVSAIFGEEPAESADQSGLLVSYKWDTPAALPGTWDAYLTYLPEGSAGANLTGFTGLVIKLTSVDPKDK